MRWHQLLGFGEENYRFHDHEKLAHYANAATDIEFKFPFGSKKWKEFIPVRISTYHNISNIPVKRFNISIPN